MQIEPNMVGRVAENIGVSGLLILAVWSIINKWAGKFLGAQEMQAKAMAELAHAVQDTVAAARSNSEDQRELLLAVRVMAKSQEDTKEWIRELAQTIQTVATHKKFAGGDD